MTCAVSSRVLLRTYTAGRLNLSRSMVGRWHYALSPSCSPCNTSQWPHWDCGQRGLLYPAGASQPLSLPSMETQQLLAIGLQQCRRLRELDLSGHCLTGASINVAEALAASGCELGIVRLAYCGIGDAAATTLLRTLQRTTTRLVELDLTSNWLEDVTEALGDCLAVQNSLRSLSIAGNHNLSAPVCILSRLRSQHLQRLDIGGILSLVTSTTALQAILTHVMRHCAALDSLGLSGTAVSDAL